MPRSIFIPNFNALVKIKKKQAAKWGTPKKHSIPKIKTCQQGIAGLDCWIAQSGLQSNEVDWIVIENPKSKLDFGFGLSSFTISIQISGN